MKGCKVTMIPGGRIYINLPDRSFTPSEASEWAQKISSEALHSESIAKERHAMLWLENQSKHYQPGTVGSVSWLIAQGKHEEAFQELHSGGSVER